MVSDDHGEGEKGFLKAERNLGEDSSLPNFYPKIPVRYLKSSKSTLTIHLCQEETTLMEKNQVAKKMKLPWVSKRLCLQRTLTWPW
ncbi:hypothetical protein L2E82_31466 [Cichorium intybus]|uniref:Uncharacterized protein n=1 Tax=Cichorium intybus TaxID=13427 RepID=A0ACB9D343_CICIN|nr:hypothetical protein L2E82_31466 [Cichorium intybus]